MSTFLWHSRSPRRFANPKVIIVYCKLLAEYRNNSDETNHQVVRMLHRLAWNLKVHPMLYQASVFKVFQNILRDYRSLPKHCVGEALKASSLDHVDLR